MLIGLVGKSGSGKTTVASMLKEYDKSIRVIEVDKIGHESHNDPVVKEKLLKYFGKEIFNEDLTVNRKVLSGIVFNSEEKMQQLYDATLEFMEKIIDGLIESSDIVVLDYALLTKLKYFQRCDLKILVTSPYSSRLNRVTKRDSITSEKYNEINANSLDYSENEFDVVINNNFDINELRKVIGDIYESYIVPRKF